MPWKNTACGATQPHRGHPALPMALTGSVKGSSGPSMGQSSLWLANPLRTLPPQSHQFWPHGSVTKSTQRPPAQLVCHGSRPTLPRASSLTSLVGLSDTQAEVLPQRNASSTRAPTPLPEGAPGSTCTCLPTPPLTDLTLETGRPFLVLPLCEGGSPQVSEASRDTSEEHTKVPSRKPKGTEIPLRPCLQHRALLSAAWEGRPGMGKQPQGLTQPRLPQGGVVA